jgi:hypothetical protein
MGELQRNRGSGEDDQILENGVIFSLYTLWYFMSQSGGSRCKD